MAKTTMIVVLSPSKTLDFETPLRTKQYTQPEMLLESQLLIQELRNYSTPKLSALMDISDKLAQLNVQRYKDFTAPFTPDNARQAILAFKGDVYTNIDVAHYAEKDFAFAQKHIRILSGLYGVLKPLDLMQAYRLEMGTKLKNSHGKDLYAFWGDRITEMLNRALVEEKSELLINLASEEYFKAVRPGRLEGEILNIVFKEKQKGKLKIIGLFAKKARGMMTDFIIKNRITDENDLKKFKTGGYKFQAKLSDDTHWVFVR